MKYDERTEVFESLRRHGIEVDKSKLGYGLPSKHFSKTAGKTNMLRHYEREAATRYLMHHGIEGQKWGVKNGPPYPLDDSTSTGKKLIKKENKRSSSAEKYREKKKAKLQKSIDKLEKKVYKKPENENSNKNLKRKMRIEHLTNRLKDLDNVSNDTLLYLKELESDRDWAILMNIIGFSAAPGLLIDKVYDMSHSDGKSIKEVLGTLNEEQQRAVANLIYILLSEEEKEA